MKVSEGRWVVLFVICRGVKQSWGSRELAVGVFHGSMALSVGSVCYVLPHVSLYYFISVSSYLTHV